MVKSKYNKKFENEISFFVNKANKNITKVKALAIYDLLCNIVDDTPLYIKGYKAKGYPGRGNVKYNWTVSIGTMNPRYLKGTDVGGSRTKERGYAQLMKLTESGDETVYIHNSHPAIMKLEYGGFSAANAGKEGSRVTAEGFSTQAPTGMLHKNVTAWNYVVDAKAKTVK